MNSEEGKHLIIRQLDDIANQADYLLNQSEPSDEEIEEFSKYSKDLKGFLLKNTTNSHIIERLNEIPDFSYKANSFWFSGRASIFKYFKKVKALDKIRLIQSLYSSIKFLFKAEIN